MSTASCSHYPLAEVANAQLAGQRALDANAKVYALNEYKRYKSSMISANATIEQQRSYWPWSRDYSPVRDVLNRARSEAEQALRVAVYKRLEYGQKITNDLRNIKNALTEIHRENARLLTQPPLRRSVMNLDLTVATAESLWHSGEYDRADSYLSDASAILATLTDRAGDLVMKMNNSSSLSKWNRLVQAAIDQSAREHRLVLIVNKYRHSLIAYKSGYRVAEYRVDLGSNAFVPKRLQGDAATPEGRYHVTRKLENGASKYHKALMINYPNTEDYRAFRLLQKRSRRRLRIGGDIGIHGEGGRNKDWTLGCVAIENEAIDDLFPYVAVGTPIVIVANETVQSERTHGGAQ
jgi:hypothetical protein